MGDSLHLDRRAHRIAADVVGDGDQYLSREQVAQILGISKGWLESPRGRRLGPPVTKLTSRMARIRRGDLLAWLEERAAASQRPIKRKPSKD